MFPIAVSFPFLSVAKSQSAVLKKFTNSLSDKDRGATACCASSQAQRACRLIGLKKTAICSIISYEHIVLLGLHS